ncbi:hypothetical protein LTR17_021861 [Elasticomyces elasticus]|nr:hypothetical protein LTR17_021861 [Elasticomyces elasticus]
MVFSYLSLSDLMRMQRVSRHFRRYIRHDLGRWVPGIIKREISRLELAVETLCSAGDHELLESIVHFDKYCGAYKGTDGYGRCDTSKVFCRLYSEAGRPITESRPLFCTSDGYSDGMLWSVVCAMFAVQLDVDSGLYATLPIAKQEFRDRASALLVHSLSKEAISKTMATDLVRRVRLELPFGRGLRGPAAKGDSQDYQFGRYCVACYMIRITKTHSYEHCPHGRYERSFGATMLDALPNLDSPLIYRVRKSVVEDILTRREQGGKVPRNAWLMAAVLEATRVLRRKALHQQPSEPQRIQPDCSITTTRLTKMRSASRTGDEPSQDLPDLISTLPIELHGEIFSYLPTTDLVRSRRINRNFCANISDHLDRSSGVIVQREKQRLAEATVALRSIGKVELLQTLVCMDTYGGLYAEFKAEKNPMIPDSDKLCGFRDLYREATASTPGSLLPGDRDDSVLRYTVSTLFMVQSQVEDGQYTHLSQEKRGFRDRTAALTLTSVSKEAISKPEAVVLVSRVRSELPFGRQISRPVVVSTRDATLKEHCEACRSAALREERFLGCLSCPSTTMLSGLSLLGSSLEYKMSEEMAARASRAVVDRETPPSPWLAAAMLEATYVWIRGMRGS